MAVVSPRKAQWRAAHWRAVLRPKWLCWHAFVVVAFWGMLWLGDWQWHCALSGNTLSWAYTFEWPLFAIFGIVFWVRTVTDEVGLTHSRAARADGPAGASASADAGPGAGANLAVGTAVAASTSAVAASTSAAAMAPDDAGLTSSHRRESESENDYAARLIAEIRGRDRRKWSALG